MVLESTTYPGTTRERLLPILEESGLAAGRDFNLAYSPERIDPGRTDHTIRTTPKVVGGLTEECRSRAAELYRLICDEVVEVSTPEVAELSKLLENIFRSVNIALVNELAQLCDRMGIDVWEVVDAAATKPFGFMRFEPGPGMGGHCLPGRPVLPRLQGARARLLHRVHRAGREAQPGAAAVLRREDRARPERRRRSRSRGSRPAARRRLQGRRRRPARGAGAEDHPAPARARRRVSYHDPHVPELPELSLASGGARRAARGVRTSPASSPPTPRSTTSGSCARRRWWSTSAASRGASRRPTWSGCSRCVSGSASRIARRAARRRADRLTVGLAAVGAWPPPATVIAWEARRGWRRRRARASPARRACSKTAEQRARRPRAGPPRTRSRSLVEGYEATPRHETVLFNLLSGFVGAFALMRLSTAGIRGGWWPAGNVRLGGRHIHHFVPGILIAFGSGAVALVTDNAAARAGARGAVRRRDRPDLRRGGPAARPPRRLLDPRGRAQRPAQPGPGRDARRRDPRAADASPRRGAGRGRGPDPAPP